MYVYLSFADDYITILYDMFIRKLYKLYIYIYIYKLTISLTK